MELSTLYCCCWQCFAVLRIRARTWSERAHALMLDGHGIGALAVAIEQYVGLKRRTLAAIDAAERRARRLAVRNKTSMYGGCNGC